MFFFICLLLFPSTVLIRSLQSLVESSLSWLSSWQEELQQDISNSISVRTASSSVDIADGRGDVPGSDSAHWSCGPDLQPQLNGPGLVNDHSKDLLQVVPEPQSALPDTQHSPPAAPAMLEKSSQRTG